MDLNIISYFKICILFQNHISSFIQFSRIYLIYIRDINDKFKMNKSNYIYYKYVFILMKS